MCWETVEVPGRGWYVRKAIHGASASKYRYIGPVGDMVVPEVLLTEDEAEAIRAALNLVPASGIRTT